VLDEAAEDPAINPAERSPRINSNSSHAITQRETSLTTGICVHPSHTDTVGAPASGKDG
jgi:hypothetical protein